MSAKSLARYFPILHWGKTYDRHTLSSDLIAAVIVTIMLIPQSMAYALLAGLPPEFGLYASIPAMVIYALLGTSRALAVGPVAVASLMTAAAVAPLAAQGTPEYLGAAIALAFLSGLLLLALGLFRLGFIANFLSHPVISGFTTAVAIVIAVGQVPHILGIKAGGKTMLESLGAIYTGLGSINPITLAIGASTLLFLYWARAYFKGVLQALGLSEAISAALARAAPVLAIVATTLATFWLGLADRGVAIVGDVPRGLPIPALPPFDLDLWRQIAVPAALIAIIGYVESISVSQTLAAKKRQRIDPNQELVALGAANIGSSVLGGFPVTGGFARSLVNFTAGAATPAAGVYTAVGMILATFFLTPLLFFLPRAMLSALIIVAVLSLVDLAALRRTFSYNRADFAAMLATVLATFAVGVEVGILSGVVLSLLLYLYRTSRPHLAEVGLVPKTQHFRNINRHEVITDPSLLSIRVDESLYFANARFLEDYLHDRVAAEPAIRNMVLMCSAINEIDLSALESLETINHRLREMNVKLHLSEVKGPVMDRLKKSHFLDALTGQVFLSQYDAFISLVPDLAGS